MEVLGFYDEPYQVAARTPPPRKAATAIRASQPPRPSADSRSRVSTLWETTEITEGSLDWWKPQVVARRKLGGRRVRVSSLGIAMVVGGVLLALMLFLVQRPERLAEESISTLRTDARAVMETLAPLEALVTSMGNSQPPDLAATTATALEAESAARALFTDARSLSGPDRDGAVAAAGGVLEVTSRTNRLIAYRLSTENALVPPSLPVSAEDTDLPSATEAVTSWRADVETGLAELGTEVLPNHRVSLEDWLASLGSWQTRYLDAVRAGDGAAMTATIEGLVAEMESLEAGLLEELAAAGGELLAELADSRKALERLLRG